MTAGAVQTACREAWKRSGLGKQVTPHGLRHYAASRTMPRGSRRAGPRPWEYRFWARLVTSSWWDATVWAKR
jgi:integrase